MKNVLKRTALAVAASAVLLGATAQTANAQVMVIDPAAILQMTLQVANMVQQLQTLQNQYQTMTSQYKAITGSTGVGGLLSNQTTDFQGEIPMQNGQSSYSNGSSAPSSNSVYGQMQSQMQGMGRTDAMTYARNQENQKAGADQQMIQQSFNRQMTELQNIQQLTAQIDQSTTQKQVDDLRARIAASQNTLTVEQNQLVAMQMMQKNQDRQNSDMSNLATKRWLVGDDSEEATSPSITGGY
ncbi:type IV secretion system protein [Paraburkholderia sp. GAS32]|uniref:type IV secretion system protein n=1 Tax=Paraburkholderia sp. GAS32 TaxID=3035129 RepID=UPI003D1A7B36